MEGPPCTQPGWGALGWHPEVSLTLLNFPWGFPPQGPKQDIQEDRDREPALLSPLPGSSPASPGWEVLTSSFFSISGCGTILSKPCTSQLSTRAPVLRGESTVVGELVLHPSCPPTSLCQPP